MDKIVAAKVFIDVAHTGSFSATADRLTMSRAMVTRCIAVMEEWFEARLFHRTTRKVSLTNVGVECLEDLKRWVDDTERMIDQFKPKAELQGTVRVATSMSFGHSQLMPAISEFMSLNTKVKIDVELLDSPQDLINNRIDLAIRIAKSPPPYLLGKPIAKCRSILVASPHYLNKNQPINSPEDLVHHQCLGHKNIETNTWTLYKDDLKKVINVNCRLITNEATSLTQACIHGAGVSFQPIYLIQPFIDNGQLVQILPGWALQDLDIFVLYPSRKHLSPIVRAIIDFLSDYFTRNKFN